MNHRERFRNKLTNEIAEKVLTQLSGFGQPLPNAKPASGNKPTVNPFMIPKQMGLNVSSSVFPNMYYVEYNLQTWRQACEQVMRMGWPVQLAALYSWTYECSPFVQGLMNTFETIVESNPIYLVNDKREKVDDWTQEICENSMFLNICKEIMLTNFWGFSVLNFDVKSNQVYKYPQQNIDPINKMLRASTFNFNDGIKVDEFDNLLFVQHSTNYEKFLGWLQPISRAFIQMNLNNNNWVAAGARLAFPVMKVMYAENSGGNEDGLNINPYKVEAENIATNIDPRHAAVIPFTLNPDGTKNYGVDVEFAQSGGGKGQHYIFSEFNEKQKDEIREMIFQGTLTSSLGSNGNRALGEVHERKYKAVADGKMEQLVYKLNEIYLPKIRKFYKNFPDLRFARNKAKQWSAEEVSMWIPALTMSGKKFTTEFFVNSGINEEYIEDKIEPTFEPVEYSVQKPTFIDRVKKKLF